MKKIKNTNSIIKVFYDIFGALPLLVTLYMYPLIPDKIPIHYWINGTIDKWGSKHELFIVPIIILLFVYFHPKRFNQTFENTTEDKITRFANFYFLLILNSLVYITLYISINFKTCLSNFNFYNFFMCAICLIFSFLGSYINHMNKDYYFSIKTKYTFKNAKIYKHINRFCGSLWLNGSFVFFPIFLFSSGYKLLIFTFLMIVIFTTFPVIYARYLQEKYLKDKLHSKKIQHSH